MLCLKTTALNEGEKKFWEIEKDEEDSLNLPREEEWMRRRRGGVLAGTLEWFGVSACMHTGVYVSVFLYVCVVCCRVGLRAV